MNTAANNHTSPTDNQQWSVEDLAKNCVLPGVTEAELPFALPFNVPKQILEKLLAR